MDFNIFTGLYKLPQQSALEHFPRELCTFRELLSLLLLGPLVTTNPPLSLRPASSGSHRDGAPQCESLLTDFSRYKEDVDVGLGL